MGVDYDAVGGWGWQFDEDTITTAINDKYGPDAFGDKYDGWLDCFLEDHNLPDGWGWWTAGDKLYGGDGYFMFLSKEDDVKLDPKPLIEWFKDKLDITNIGDPKIVVKLHVW